MKTLLLTILLLVTFQANAINCGPTKVNKIETYRAHEGFWLFFDNGTQFVVRPDLEDKGGNNALTIALSALAMGANVNINLSDISQCGAGGNATSWVTINIVR